MSNRRKKVAGLCVACVFVSLGVFIGGPDARHLVGMTLAGAGLALVGWLQRELFPEEAGAVPQKEQP